MNKKTFISIGLMALLLAGCFHTPKPQSTESGGELGSEPNSTTEKTVFAMSEVEKHGGADDCWLAIHGSVYDVTDFIPKHPGGEAILEGCGTDATELYETRPMGSGTPHSQRARGLLEDYFIGELAD